MKKYDIVTEMIVHRKISRKNSTLIVAVAWIAIGVVQVATFEQLVTPIAFLLFGVGYFVIALNYRKPYIVVKSGEISRNNELWIKKIRIDEITEIIREPRRSYLIKTLNKKMRVECDNSNPESFDEFEEFLGTIVDIKREKIVRQ